MMGPPPGGPGGMGPPPGGPGGPGGPHGGPGRRHKPVDKKELKELQKNDFKFVVPFIKAQKKALLELLYYHYLEP